MAGKSMNPKYPDAHPTAPGGMSRAGLVAELVEKHGYEDDAAAWRQVAWPTLIEMVIAERLDRDAEKAQKIMAENEGASVGMVEEALVDAGLDPDSDRPEPEYIDTEGDFDSSDQIDNLLAEFGLDEQTQAATKDVDDTYREMFPDELPTHEPEYRGNDACKCGTPESEHHNVDPPHSFMPQGFDELSAYAGGPDAMPTPNEELVETWREQNSTLVETWSTTTTTPFDDDQYLDPESLFAEMAAGRDEYEASLPAPLFLGLPVVQDYVFDGHAGAGPSGAERWMNCTMSLSASRRFLETLSPNQQRTYAESSTAARQGTTAHAVGETKANLALGRISDDEADFDLLSLALEPADGEEYDEEMEEYVAEYVDLINTYAVERGNEAVLIEARVEAAIPLTDMHEGEVYVIRGSADTVVVPVPDHPTLVVGDLKYGVGKDVDVDENPQIRLYALAVLALLVDDEGELPSFLDDVVYHIIQPRLGGIKTWTESVDDLLTWRDEVLAPALTLALYGENEGATYTPSDLACQWCPARGGCTALAEAQMVKAADLFDLVQDTEFSEGPGALPDAGALSNDRLGELLTQAKAIKDLYTNLREEAQLRLHRGDEVPGYWLVNYSPNRQWVEGAEEKLSATPEAWTDPTPKLLSPAQAEKALGKEKVKRLEGLIHKPEKRPVISTGAGDNRSKWESHPPEQMFPDLEE